MKCESAVCGSERDYFYVMANKEIFEDTVNIDVMNGG